MAQNYRYHFKVYSSFCVQAVGYPQYSHRGWINFLGSEEFQPTLVDNPKRHSKVLEGFYSFKVNQCCNCNLFLRCLFESSQMQSIFSLASLFFIQHKVGYFNTIHYLFCSCNMETCDKVMMSNGTQDSEAAHYAKQLTKPQVQKRRATSWRENLN